MRVVPNRIRNPALGLSFAALAASMALAQDASLPGAGDEVSGRLSPERPSARYSLTVTEPRFLLAEVEQLGVDVVVRLLGPANEALAEHDANASGRERFAERLREPGLYHLELALASDATAEEDEVEAGEYVLRTHRLEPVASDPAQLSDQLMARYDLPGSPGATVQVWRDGRTLFSRAYGLANLSHDIPFETHTRTNIGSTSKQFTAFAVLLEQERGALQLDDDIREHLPEIPDFGPTITIRHLLTHTSGLREFINLLVMAGRRVDRGDWIDRAELLEVVQRQPALQNEPGAEWNYNNTAFGLAALIVERSSKTDFHEYMEARVFGPLGMTRSMVRPTPKHLVPQSSEGYTPGDDGFLTIGDIGGAVGAGAIYSSIEDLQLWAENLLEPRVGTPAMIEAMMTADPASVGKALGGSYGLGLFLDQQRGLRRVHHGGADMAHRSMLALYPEIRAGITVQSNHASFDSSVAFELAAAFFADAMEPEPGPEGLAQAAEFDASTFEAEDFDRFVGRYSLDPSPEFILRFSREGDSFFTQATGQSKLEIAPISPTRFRLRGVDAEVEFLSDSEGSIEGLTLFQNGEHHATRLAGEAPAAWKPTADELQGYAGRYTSRELETSFLLLVEEEHLVVRRRRAEDLSLQPGARDEFAGDSFRFSFERDRNGQILGFYLSNGRTRDVRFAATPSKE